MSIFTALERLMGVPGLSGHEDRVRQAISEELDLIGVAHRSDRLGNLIATFPGTGPSVLLFTHMDQLGFVVRKVEKSGFLRVERVGGVPERALASQEILVAIGPGQDVPGVIANKSHHATAAEDKYQVVPVQDIYLDCGFETADDAEAAGVRIGVPVVYAPAFKRLGAHRLMGPAVDDRAGCAVLIDIARRLAARETGPTVHLAFTVLEEFNLRGALPVAHSIEPDIAIQIDLMLASDTPDMADRGDMFLGRGPAISLYSFHGRGTLNGVIPHPALVALIERTAAAEGLTLQRSAQSGILTDLSYVQLVGKGIAAIDVGFPMRYSHASREVVDLRDLEDLAELLHAALATIGPDFDLSRDAKERM